MKKHNFNAGPSILPREVIENTAQAILCLLYTSPGDGRRGITSYSGKLQLPSLKKRVLLSATDAEEIPQFAGVGGDSPDVYKRQEQYRISFGDIEQFFE